jgi:hypothetical protein
MNRFSRKLSIAALFFLLVTWLSIPYGGSGDMDYHLTSIWCAWGEKAKLCNDIQVLPEDPNAQFRNNATAEVPFMFQMCDSRNIDFWPYCELESQHPETQRLRMAPPEHLSLYYKMVHVFVDENVQKSVFLIRLFNLTLALTLVYALLTITSSRIRFASLSGLTFTLLPYGPQIFTGVTTRSWAILGVMTSWAFLFSFLTESKDNRFRRILQICSYLISMFLALSTRLDAFLMVVITSIFVLIWYRNLHTPIKIREVLIASPALLSMAVASQYLPVIKEYANFKVPEIYGTSQYLFFQIVHIPEFVADWWNYQIGQGGSGPGVVGLVGVILFAVNVAFALQNSNFQQRLMFASFTFVVFILLAKTSSLTRSIVPLSGFYTLGLATPWLGIVIASSKNKLQFMSSIGNRRMAIFLLSFSHAVYFYSLLEFYTKRGKNIGYFDTISLNGEWWWNIGIGPNTVFFGGAVLFPLFLILTWRSIPLEIAEEPPTLRLQGKS